MTDLAKGKISAVLAICLGFVQLASGCAFARPITSVSLPTITPEINFPLPTANHRPVYVPGELVSYTAQSGDNLPMLAARFNTSEPAIREANPIIPPIVSTLPQGFPMQIPIYYTPFWGSTFKLIPNSAFVFSSEAQSFGQKVQNISLKDKPELNELLNVVENKAEAFVQACLQASIDPHLMLSLIVYGLEPDGELQLASNQMIDKIKQADFGLLQHWMGVLNHGYYSYETGRLVELELPDGSIERLDPWQNAGSAAMRYFFSKLLRTSEGYQAAVKPNGFVGVYFELFGNPWVNEREILPGSLEWISAGLPINPQGGWQAAVMPELMQKMMPWPGASAGFHASIQDASDKNAYGKVYSIMNGTITRLDNLQLVVSQFGMPETQGWSIVYLGVAVKPGLKVGDELQIGQSIGQVDAGDWNASFWLARKYNGEWVPAGGAIPFNLGDWKLALDVDGQSLVMHKPELTVYSQPYQGQTNLIPAN